MARGLAWPKDFQHLDIWQHSALSRSKKLRTFDACVCSKLCYGPFWPPNRSNVYHDDFQAWCLTKIAWIAPLYWPNIQRNNFENHYGIKSEWKQCKAAAEHMDKLATHVNDDPGRRCIFKTGNMELRKQIGCRKRGRPRAGWATEIFREWCGNFQTSW